MSLLSFQISPDHREQLLNGGIIQGAWVCVGINQMRPNMVLYNLCHESRHSRAGARQQMHDLFAITGQAYGADAAPDAAAEAEAEGETIVVTGTRPIAESEAAALNIQRFSIEGALNGLHLPVDAPHPSNQLVFIASCVRHYESPIA